MRKPTLFAILVAVVTLCFTNTAKSASVDSQYLYVNAKLAPAVDTYTWINCYRYQGTLAGDVFLGDLAGVNFLHGTPAALSFSGANSHVDGPSQWNGMISTYSVDFTADTSMAWTVSIANVPVWAGSSAFEWIGIYRLP